MWSCPCRIEGFERACTRCLGGFCDSRMSLSSCVTIQMWSLGVPIGAFTVYWHFCSDDVLWIRSYIIPSCLPSGSEALMIDASPNAARNVSFGTRCVDLRNVAAESCFSPFPTSVGPPSPVRIHGGIWLGHGSPMPVYEHPAWQNRPCCSKGRVPQSVLRWCIFLRSSWVMEVLFVPDRSRSISGRRGYCVNHIRSRSCCRFLLISACWSLSCWPME